MKTNHQRGFKQNPGPWAGPGANGDTFDRERLGLKSYFEMNMSEIKAEMGNRIRTGKAAGDATNGKHGLAQQNRGLKKFINSRNRFKDHMLERELLKNNEDDCEF